MQIEIHDDVPLVTVALALAGYGLQLRHKGAGIQVERGPAAAAGDVRVSRVLAALAQRKEASHGGD